MRESAISIIWIGLAMTFGSVGENRSRETGVYRTRVIAPGFAELSGGE